jgi:multidrug transporter EmrE-like cation transporter
MNELLPYCGIMLLGVLMGGVSQILLKKSAGKSYTKWYQAYLNPYVIIAYTIFVLSTVCTVLAYRVVPLSMSPLWTSASYIAVTAMSYLILKERPNRKKLTGIAIITVGIIIFCL